MLPIDRGLDGLLLGKVGQEEIPICLLTWRSSRLVISTLLDPTLLSLFFPNKFLQYYLINLKWKYIYNVTNICVQFWGYQYNAVILRENKFRKLNCNKIVMFQNGKFGNHCGRRKLISKVVRYLYLQCHCKCCRYKASLLINNLNSVTE